MSDTHAETGGEGGAVVRGRIAHETPTYVCRSDGSIREQRRVAAGDHDGAG
jgi:hypothetical protein